MEPIVRALFTVTEIGDKTVVAAEILNALAHMDYSVYTENTPIRIEMYRDRIEIINSGGLYGNISIDSLGKVHPDTRNAVLANILEYCKTPRTRAELISYVGKTRSYVMAEYIQPLVDSGQLAMTLPYKPKSSKQRYVSNKNNMIINIP